MKDLGTVDVILEIKIRYTKDETGLSQSHDIEHMLKKYGYFDLSELSVPNDYNKKFQPDTRRSIRQLEYSKIVSSFMYAMSRTRSCIAFSVRMLSKFTSNPEKPHWDAVQRLMRYLERTMIWACPTVDIQL